MLNESEKSKLIEDLQQAQKEVNELRLQLNKVNADKENWFKRKSSIFKEIKDRISALKGSKTKRNSLTKDVRDLKKKRDEMNKSIVNGLKEINDIKSKINPSTKIKLYEQAKLQEEKRILINSAFRNAESQILPSKKDDKFFGKSYKKKFEDI